MFPQWEFLSRSHSCADNLPTRAAAVEERLGSGSEADHFRVDLEHGSLVKGLATRKALQSLRSAFRVRWPNVGLRFTQDIEHFYSVPWLKPMTIAMSAARSTQCLAPVAGYVAIGATR